MTQEKDNLGEQLRLAERAREDRYFRQLDQALLTQMWQQERAEPLFTSILVPVDFSPYSTVVLHQFGGTSAPVAKAIARHGAAGIAAS